MYVALSLGVAEAQETHDPRGRSVARRVIYINLDGFKYEYLDWAREAGVPTPALDSLIAGGTLFTAATSGVPTITIPMQTSIVTGAWPAVHGNTYRYFDGASGEVRQTGRDNRAQTIAEAAAAAGLSTASVQQFMLLGRGTSYDDPSHLYVQPDGPARRRIETAVALLQGRPVAKGDAAPARLPRVPDFLAIYCDDLDAVGHNGGQAYYPSIKVARDQAAWRANLVAALAEVDSALALLLDAIDREGLWPGTALILTSDHGMAPCGGPSSRRALVGALRDAGFAVEALGPGQAPSRGTELALVTVGLQAQLSFVGPVSDERRAALAAAAGALADEEWFGGTLDAEGLAAAGAAPGFADLLVSPRSPHHFKAGILPAPLRGQHDSLECRHVPLIARGAGLRSGARIDGPATLVDVAPTIARLLGIPAPAQATGRILREAFEDE